MINCMQKKKDKPPKWFFDTKFYQLFLGKKLDKITFFYADFEQILDTWGFDLISKNII